MGQFSHRKFRQQLFRFPIEGKVPGQFEKSISQGQRHSPSADQEVTNWIESGLRKDSYPLVILTCPPLCSRILMVSRSGSEGWTTTMPGDQLFIFLTISL